MRTQEIAPDTPMTQETTAMPIAVACDVKLGALFRNAPDLKGKYIDIDPEAAARIVRSFNPDATHPITVTAMHSDSLSDGIEGTALFHAHKPIEVKVGIGKIGLEKSETDQQYRRTLNLLQRVGHMSEEYHEETIMEFYGTESTRSGWDLQATAVHELRHAADFQKTFLMMLESTYIVYSFGKAILPAAFKGALHEIRQRRLNKASGATSLILSAVVACMASMLDKESPEMKAHAHEKGTQSPMERAAYATADYASSMPNVIHIKDLKSLMIEQA